MRNVDKKIKHLFNPVVWNPEAIEYNFVNSKSHSTHDIK